MAALESLDDLPPVVFPLQYLPLINHRRLGPLSYRSWMIANGEAKPREGEAILDRAAIESALAETELAELVETRGQLQALQARLRGIRDICVDRAGGDRAAKLEKLPGLVDKILALVDEVVVKRDPSLAAGRAARSPTAPRAGRRPSRPGRSRRRATSPMRSRRSGATSPAPSRPVLPCCWCARPSS